MCIITKYCKYGFTDAGNDCMTCPKYGQIVNENGSCTCPNGDASDPNFCNQNCIDTTYRHYKNTPKGKCVVSKYCKNGFDDNNTCICKYGEINYDNDGNPTCNCPNGNAKIDGYCNEKCKNGRYVINQNSDYGKCTLFKICPYGVDGDKCNLPINPPNPPSPNQCDKAKSRKAIGGGCYPCQFGATIHGLRCMHA